MPVGEIETRSRRVFFHHKGWMTGGGYNVAAGPEEVRLHLDRTWRRATRAGLDERLHGELALEGTSVRFVAGPKEIVTVRFEA